MQAGPWLARYLVMGTASLVPLMVTIACSTSPGTAVQPTATAVLNQGVPAIAAAPTDVVATADALRTQIAPTLNAAATQVAPTLIAVQTQSIPTLNAIATEVVPTVNAAATTTAESGLRITDVQLAASEPSVTVQNDGDRTIDLSTWTVEVASTPVILPPNTQLGPGDALVLHGSNGTGDNHNVYLGSAFETALNALQPGAQVMLDNPSGSTVASFTVPSAP
jgi:hypothetical protein